MYYMRILYLLRLKSFQAPDHCAIIHRLLDFAGASIEICAHSNEPFNMLRFLTCDWEIIASSLYMYDCVYYLYFLLYQLVDGE